MRKLLIRKNKDKKYVAAITTIELVLILVILIALLLIFKEQLISLITTIFALYPCHNAADSSSVIPGLISFSVRSNSSLDPMMMSASFATIE